MPKRITLKTLSGEMILELGGPDSDGRRAGGIEFCAFRDDHCIQTNMLEQMILAHACAGVDVESDSYIEGINTSLDFICNSEEEDENPNPPESPHTIIAADTHEIDAEIVIKFSYTESLNEMHLQEEPMSVEEIHAWVLDDIMESGLNDQLREIGNYLTVKVRAAVDPD